MCEKPTPQMSNRPSNAAHSAPRSTSTAKDACAPVRDDLVSIVWVFIAFSSLPKCRLSENARHKIVDKQQQIDLEPGAAAGFTVERYDQLRGNLVGVANIGYSGQYSDAGLAVPRCIAGNLNQRHPLKEGFLGWQVAGCEATGQVIGAELQGCTPVQHVR